MKYPFLSPSSCLFSVTFDAASPTLPAADPTLSAATLAALAASVSFTWQARHTAVNYRNVTATMLRQRGFRVNGTACLISSLALDKFCANSFLLTSSDT